MNQIDIGKFIADCRKEKGLTQAQLAEKLNITDKAVSKWETGKSMPDSSIMLELSNILGVTVNELLSGERIEMNNYPREPSGHHLGRRLPQRHPDGGRPHPADPREAGAGSRQPGAHSD